MRMFIFSGRRRIGKLDFNDIRKLSPWRQILINKFSMISKIIVSDYSKTTILIRLMVGTVFFSEGTQKLLFPAIRGAGRFEKIGLPMPEFLGSFVGLFEILCGTLIIVGLFTRLASIPLIIIMLVALGVTKLEILIDHGGWEMLHRSRTDWAMLLGSIFLFFRGSGRWSLDNYINVSSV